MNGSKKADPYLAILPVNAVGTIAIHLAMKAAQKTGAVFSNEIFDETIDGSDHHEVFIWKNGQDRAVRELAETVKIYNKAMENLLGMAFKP